MPLHSIGRLATLESRYFNRLRDNGPRRLLALIPFKEQETEVEAIDSKTAVDYESRQIKSHGCLQALSTAVSIAQTASRWLRFDCLFFPFLFFPFFFLLSSFLPFFLAETSSIGKDAATACLRGARRVKKRDLTACTLKSLLQGTWDEAVMKPQCLAIEQAEEAICISPENTMCAAFD